MKVLAGHTLGEHPAERGRGAGVEHVDVLHGVRPLEAEPLGVIAAGSHRHAHHQVV